MLNNSSATLCPPPNSLQGRKRICVEILSLALFLTRRLELEHIDVTFWLEKSVWCVTFEKKMKQKRMSPSYLWAWIATYFIRMAKRKWIMCNRRSERGDRRAPLTLNFFSSTLSFFLDDNYCRNFFWPSEQKKETITITLCELVRFQRQFILQKLQKYVPVLFISP